MSATPLPRTRLARAVSIVMVAFVVSRLLGLVREAVVAARFGDSTAYAAYQAAFGLPDLLFNLIAGGALASAFLPTFTLYLTSERHGAGWRLASAVANWIVVVLGVLSLLAAIFAVPIVDHLLAPGFERPLVELTATLMRFMLISTVIFSLSGLAMSILNAYEHYLTPALAPIMYNLGILAGALFLAPSMGIFGLAWGVILGAAGHALVQLPMLRRYGLRYVPVLGLRDPEISENVRRVARLMAPRVLGAAVVQLMFLSNRIIGSFFDPAVIPILNYAWIIMLLPHGVFASSVATAIFPTFSRQAALGDRAGMQRALAQTLRMILFVTVPAAVGLFVLRVPVIELLFERGEFTSQTTLAVAWALAFYCIGLVPHSLIEIINRAFFAVQDTWTPVIVGTIAMLGNIGLGILFALNLGSPDDLTRGPQGGLALANATAASIEIWVLLWLIRRKIGGLEGRALLASGLRTGGAALLMGLALAAMLRFGGALPTFLFVPLAVSAGGALFVAAAWLLGSDEARTLPRRFLRR